MLEPMTDLPPEGETVSRHAGDAPTARSTYGDHAVPLLALKSKEGEIEALTATPAGVIPMIEMLDTVKDQSGSRVFPSLVKRGVEMVRAGNPLWIDIRWMSGSGPLSRVPQGVLNELDRRIEADLGFDAATFDGPWLVPVIPLSVGDAELAHVRYLVEHTERDVGVRISAVGTTGSPEVLARIKHIARAVGLATTSLHVIVDESYVEHAQPAAVDAALNLIGAIRGSLRVGSVTLLGGSVPKQRTSYTTHVRERAEWDLWHTVRDRLGEDLRYGDYGVVHPIPNPGEGGRLPSPYVHYTVDKQSLFVGRKVPRKSSRRHAEYFSEVADELTDRPEYSGAGYCWGRSTVPRMPELR